MAVASIATSDCSADIRTTGYLEVERASVISVIMSESAQGLHPGILRVEEQPPAWHAGIDPGYPIVAVDGQETCIPHPVSLDLALSVGD